MRLFGRVLLTLSAFSLIPAALTAGWFLASQQRIRSNARELHGHIATLGVRVAESSVGELNRALGFVSDLERLGDPASAAGLGAVQAAVLSQPGLAFVGILSADGAVLASAGDARLKAATAGDEVAAVVKEAFAQGRLSAGASFLAEGRPLLPVVHPLTKGGGVLALFDLSGVRQRFERMALGEGSALILTDLQGRVLKGFEESGLPDLPAGEEPQGWAESLPSSRGELVGAYATLPAVGWRVWSLQPKREAYSIDEAFYKKALGGAAAMFLVVVAAASWIAGLLTAPLETLAQGAARVASGRFDAKVPERGWAEIRSVAASFNEMMGRLDSYQKLQVDRQLDEKAKVEALVRTIPDGLMLIGLDGRILYINEAAELVLSLAGTSVVGRLVQEVFDLPATMEFVVSLMARSRTGEPLEISAANKEGGRIGVFSCRSAVVERSGIDLGILIHMRDVTAERELDKMKQSILETVTHDLRSPLTSITGFAELLLIGRSGPVNEAQKTKIGVILSAAKQLGELIDDILDVSKFESGMMELSISPGRIEPLVQAVHALLSVQAQNEGVGLVLDIAADLPPVEMEPGKIQRVITNLVTNALKFTPKGGTITVSARRHEAGVLVAVRDTGVGIPADKVGKLFTKFFQVEETRGEAKRRGTGLGLTICRQVVEAHKGRIWAESQWRQGSVFQFTLPASARS